MDHHARTECTSTFSLMWWCCQWYMCMLEHLYIWRYVVPHQDDLLDRHAVQWLVYVLDSPLNYVASQLADRVLMCSPAETKIKQ